MHISRKQTFVTWFVLLGMLAGIMGMPFNPAFAFPESAETDRDAYFLTKISAALPATDSASSATAIATGWKTDGGNIAWKSGDPLGGQLTTIAQYVRGAPFNFSIGVASTVQFSHATPGAFVSHNLSRNNYAAIAQEIINTTQPQVVIGGGHPLYFSTPANYNYVGGQTLWNNLITGATSYTHYVARQAGIDGGAALRNTANSIDLAAHPEHKLIGVFGGPGGSFEYHSVADAPGAPAITLGSVENPSLADVTTSTLKVLSQDSDGFFVMFEQGAIDWANHENNFQHMIGGVWELEQAVKTATAYIDQAGGPQWADSLIIVTADHSNSYMRLPYPLGQGDLPTQQWVDLNNNGAVNAGEWYYPNGEVTYRTNTHTNELVSLYARGAHAADFTALSGTWYPGTTIIDNTQIYQVMKGAVDAGVKHIILFIGDGMNIAHEIAASRYLYGSDYALTWNSWETTYGGVALPVATWDVTTYNQYGSTQPVAVTWNAAGAGAFNLGTNNAHIGYDPARGGALPYPPPPGDAELTTSLPYLYFEINPGQVTSSTFTLSKTGNVNLAWSVAAAPPAGWLTASPAAGYLIYDGAATITANINSSNLPPGHYRSALKISTSYRDITVPVILKVRSAGTAPAATSPFTMQFLGSYRTGKNSAAEIVSYDPATYQLYVTNAVSRTLDVLSIANLTSVPTPTLTTQIDIQPYGDDITAVDLKNGLLAVALPARPKTSPGTVLFMQGNQAVTVTVGALPNMLTFSPDGMLLLVANAGEPSPDYTIDPNGSVSMIDVSGGIDSIDQAKVTTLDFSSFTSLDPSIRIYGLNPSIAQDLEPEHITVAPDSSTAWVALQENNAIATLDLQTKTIRAVRPLGFKDWSGALGLDTSDSPKSINLTNQSVWGMYQPDGIAAYSINGTTYLVTANEGDSRDYTALGGTFNEETRIKDANLDPTVFPHAAELKADDVLGRLKVTRYGAAGSAYNPDPDDDGDLDALYAFGARSFSIWNAATGQLLWDSGDQLERIVAARTPAYFNANNGSPTTFDERSDDRGPEPEAIVLADLDGRTFAFIGLERGQGGVMVYDVSNPAAPVFALYMPNAPGDISPEGLCYIPALQSPTRRPLLVLANEGSGSTAVFQISLPTQRYYLPLISK